MEERINPYRRAAENGIPFGAYLSAMAVGSIFADRMPLLALAVLVMMVATPVVVYRFQRRYFIDEQGFTEFAADQNEFYKRQNYKCDLPHRDNGKARFHLRPG